MRVYKGMFFYAGMGCLNTMLTLSVFSKDYQCSAMNDLCYLVQGEYRRAQKGLII